MVKYVEILSIGNELLIGKTLNTNAQWLAKRINALGLSVSQTTTIGDDVEKIAETLQRAIQRKPNFIITTGGLGPTFDDKTLQGVALALNTELEVNEKALKMVTKKYSQYSQKMKHGKLELTPARIKMATIPRTADPLPNTVGTAPAAKLETNNVDIFILPGVPSEMKAIFDESLMPILKAVAGNLTYYEASLFVDGVMESEMAPLIDQVMHDNPFIYIKSHPLGAEKKPNIELHLSTTTKNFEMAKKRVGRALMQLTEMARDKGGKTRTTRPKNQ